MSVHWVEINFSTNLVIARRGFQERVEAERLLHRRQAGRQVVMPHFLRESAGGESGCGDLGSRIRTQMLKRGHLHELLSTFSEMSALSGSLLHRIAAVDKCVIHCCSLLCPLRISSPDTLMLGATPFISASVCVRACARV